MRPANAMGRINEIMLKYIGKRILIMIPILIGISLLVFFILTIMPGDVAVIQIGSSATEENVALWKEQHGLNDPFFVRYFKYIGGVLRGDFGSSWRTNLDVKMEFSQRISSTVILSVGALFLVCIIGLPIGILSAVKQYTMFDYSCILMTLLLTSIPAFWLGLVLMLFISLQLNLLPSTGADTFAHYILPWITLSATLTAQTIRMARSTMLEVIRQEYIKTAKAKGARPYQVIIKHALRNALLPLITVIGLQFGVTIGGTIVTESVFAIPGVGTYLLQAVKQHDVPAVMISVLFIAAVIGVTNLVVDILYMFVDPRLRTQLMKGRVKG